MTTAETRAENQAESPPDCEIPVCRPLLPSAARIMPYLSLVDESRHYANRGHLEQKLEKRLSQVLGAETLIAVLAGSGTAALVGAILASAGRAQPDRPIALIPAYTFIGTLHAVQLCGYTPFLMDVDPNTWSLDPAVCAAQPDLERVGLVVPVAPYGRGVPQAPWRAFRDETGIAVAIDGAAAIEALTDAPQRYAGNIPVALSFHATKTFCTGEGGAVVCSDYTTLRRANQSLNFGYNADRQISQPGLNGKMSEYHAAVGLAEMDGWSAKRAAYRRVAACYAQIAARLGIDSTLNVAPAIASNYVILDAATAEHSDTIGAALTSRRIGYRLWYGRGLRRIASFQTFESAELTVTDDLAARLIGLPMAVDMQADDIEYVLGAIAGLGLEI